MTTFKVEGMTCGHCRTAVERAVHGVDAAAAVAVDLDRGTVSVDGAGEPAARIAEAIRAEGYAVTGTAA